MDDICKYCKILYNTTNTILVFSGFHQFFSCFTILYTLLYCTSLQAGAGRFGGRSSG